MIAIYTLNVLKEYELTVFEDNVLVSFSSSTPTLLKDNIRKDFTNLNLLAYN